MASAQLFATVPFYAGLTLEEIGGKGVRWPQRAAASAFGEVQLGPFVPEAPPAPAVPNGRLRLGTFRSMWRSPEVAASPSLRFLRARAARRDGAGRRAAPRRLRRRARRRRPRRHGVDAIVALRAATPEGTVFVEGTALDGPLVEVRKIT